MFFLAVLPCYRSMVGERKGFAVSFYSLSYSVLKELLNTLTTFRLVGFGSIATIKYFNIIPHGL